MTVLRMLDEPMQRPVGDTQPADDETLARKAAETLRSDIEDLGLTEPQINAVLRAASFVLIDKNEQAKAALRSNFSEDSVATIFPAMIEGLSHAA